jgi:hypothetical protein
VIDTAWPDRLPDVAPSREGWFDQRNRAFLSCFVGPGDVVVEIGAWTGNSTLWLAEKVGEAGHVYTIDHFKGSWEHQADPGLAAKLPTLWETFVVNCWDSRDRITPVRADSRVGLLALYNRAVRPALVYVDGAHDYDTAVRDLLLSAFLWPSAQLVGDDFEHPDVQRAAFDAAKVLQRELHGNKRCFALGGVEEKHPEQPRV